MKTIINISVYTFTLLTVLAGEILANPLTQGVEKAVNKGKSYIGGVTVAIGSIVAIGLIINIAYNIYTEGYRNEPIQKVISTIAWKAVGIAFFVTCVAIGEFLIKELM